MIYLIEGFSESESFAVFGDFVRGLHSTNDCAERNIKLIQDYVMSSNKEEARQNIIFFAQDNRKKMSKVCGKSELKNL